MGTKGTEGGHHGQPCKPKEDDQLRSECQVMLAGTPVAHKTGEYD